MSRATLGAGALFFAIFLVASGCFQPIDRPANAAPTTVTTEPTPSPTQMPTSTPTITPSETPVPSPTSTPAAPEPTVTIAMLETATPTVTPTPNDPAGPTNTPVPTVEPEPTATATFAPQPTSTFTPVPTPGDNLFLEVLGPIDGQTVQVESILVYGFTKPGAAVKINQNQITASPGGQFQRIVQLSEGVNRLEVVASNGTEPDQTKILNVTRLPQQPFILIVTRPANFSVVNRSPIQVIGVTSPHAIVSVNGVTINVDLGGIFQTEIALKPDELNNVDVIATNVDGEVKSTRISVFYSPG